MIELQDVEISALLQLLAKHIFGINQKIELDEIDLEKLYEEAKSQTIIAVSFAALPLETRDLNPQVYDEWQKTAFAIMQQTINNNFANVKLTELLNNNGIEHCTIKGYASAYYYPNPCFRQMGDIDFIIKKNQNEKSMQLLLDLGFMHIDENSYHNSFKKGKMIYEMHTDITETINEKSFYSDMIEDIVENGVKVSSSVGEICIPSKFHHGVIMLAHMQRHMVTGSGIGLRHLVDWAVFVNSIENDEWEEIFEEKLKKTGLWKFAKTISKTASIYIKLPEKQWFSGADEDLATALIYDIFDGGNFGRKSTTRNMQKIMEGNDSQNKVIRLLRGTKKWIYKKYPVCDRYKVLLPLMFIAHSFKILFKVIFKSTDYKFSEVLKKGEEQYNTYDRLGFFKEEKSEECGVH